MSNLSRVPGLLLLPLNLFPYYGSAVAIHSCPPSGQTMAGTNHRPCLNLVALLECTNSTRALTQARHMLNLNHEAGSVPRFSTSHFSFLFFFLLCCQLAISSGFEHPARDSPEHLP